MQVHSQTFLQVNMCTLANHRATCDSVRRRIKDPFYTSTCAPHRLAREMLSFTGLLVGVYEPAHVSLQPPRLVDLLYREDPHILCFREACQQPSLPSLFGMPHGHSLSCLLIRRYRMSAVTFCLLLCVPRYQLAQTPVSPHGAAGQHKQTPPSPSSVSWPAFFAGGRRPCSAGPG